MRNSSVKKARQPFKIAYDADGNLLQDENYKYTYNEQQRLTTVATLADKTIASYTYDENGLRLTKTVGDTTHEYFYTNEVLDMEVVKVNDVITEYRSYKWSGYTPLSMMVKAKNDAGTFETKAYQFITNHRGDVLSIRDKDDQEVGAYTYDAYGNVLTVEGDLAKANPIRYVGYYYDEETKNYYLQARYYNPANGAFLALDPYSGNPENPSTQNGYSYANGNPTNYIDSNGEFAQYFIVGVYFAYKVYKVRKYVKTVNGVKKYKTVKKKKKVKKIKKVKLTVKNVARAIYKAKRKYTASTKTDAYHKIAGQLSLSQLNKGVATKFVGNDGESKVLL